MCVCIFLPSNYGFNSYLGTINLKPYQEEKFAFPAQLWMMALNKCKIYLFYLKIIFFCFFRGTPATYGNSRLGVESELQLTAYTTATATLDPSHVCNLHHSS